MTDDKQIESVNIENLDTIARAAAAEILAVYQQSPAIEVSLKSDDSPVTEADQRAHELIVTELTRLDPEIPILSEEADAIGYDIRRQWTRYWLVDPLDGTKEFINRNGEYTVNIALIDQGVATMGLVHVPVTGLSYLGVVNKGAWKKPAEGRLQQISSGLVDPNHTHITLAVSRNHKGSELERFVNRLGDRFDHIHEIDMGSSLKICLAAEGKVDLYPRLAPTCEWDTAAAHAVLTAAGGELVDTHFNPLRYNQKEDLLNPHFYAIADPSYPWQALISQMP